MLSLWRARRAVAAVEFAMLLPVLLILLYGLVDGSRAIVMVRRLTVAASEVATIASTQAVQASNLNALTGTQAWQATTAAFALFPQWRQGTAGGNFAITLSSVSFTASSKTCTSNCSYTAAVAWSVANPAGQSLLRACGSLSSVADGTQSTLTSLPADAFGATSVLVADVQGNFTSLFQSTPLGNFWPAANLVLTRSAYVSPRVNNGVALTSTFPGPYHTCPGVS